MIIGSQMFSEQRFYLVNLNNIRDFLHIKMEKNTVVLERYFLEVLSNKAKVILDSLDTNIRR